VPAAAVIPAPIAYIKVVAVETLVVGFRDASYSVARLYRCVGIAVSVRWLCPACRRAARLLLLDSRSCY